jgi:hypothetical protein
VDAIRGVEVRTAPLVISGSPGRDGHEDGARRPVRDGRRRHVLQDAWPSAARERGREASAGRRGRHRGRRHGAWKAFAVLNLVYPSAGFPTAFQAMLRGVSHNMTRLSTGEVSP